MRAANKAYNFESRFAIWYDENIKLHNHLIPYISLIIVYVLYNRGYYPLMAQNVHRDIHVYIKTYNIYSIYYDTWEFRDKLELGVKQTLKGSLLLIIFTLVGVREQIKEKWVLWEHEKDL